MRLGDTLRTMAGIAAYPAVGHRVHARAFDAADLAVDLTGQVHVVTGGTAGIGLGVARGLRKLGATVVVIARDAARAERVRGEVGVEVELADLSSTAEVRAVADRVLARHPRIHGLCDNAGASFAERRLSADGLEATFALDVLGGFLLTHLLVPALAKPARLVHVGSAAIYTARLDVDALLDPGRAYHGPLVYARCKRAQIELSALWAERLAPRGITVNAMHPGLAATSGTAAAFPRYHRVLGRVLRDVDQGADTAVWLLASPAVRDRTGELFFDRAPEPTHLVPWTRTSRAEAERLWAACARLAGLPAESLEHQR